MPSEDPDEPQLDVRIEVSRPEVTIAYDMRAGTEYAFGVRITNCSYSRLELQGYRARFEWAAHLCWPGDPRVSTPERKVYRLESGREFPCENVLNHRVREQGALNPGDSVEGILLAYTMFDRIPFHYIHGDTELARLCVEDQYRRRHYSLIEFSIDRRATMPPRAFRPRGTGLRGEAELKSQAAVTPATDHADRRRESSSRC
jgi:hypothetical protein